VLGYETGRGKGKIINFECMQRLGGMVEVRRHGGVQTEVSGWRFVVGMTFYSGEFGGVWEVW